MGGFDKIELGKGPAAINAYMKTLVPLVERGQHGLAIIACQCGQGGRVKNAVEHPAEFVGAGQGQIEAGDLALQFRWQGPPGAEQQDRYQCEQGFQGLYRIRGPRRGTEAVITAPTRNRMGA